MEESLGLSGSQCLGQKTAVDPELKSRQCSYVVPEAQAEAHFLRFGAQAREERPQLCDSLLHTVDGPDTRQDSILFP